MIKRFVWLAIVGFILTGLIVADGGYKAIHGDGLCTLLVTDAGDTAQVIKVNKFTANDSFTFIDTINSTTVEYTSPLQAMIIIVNKNVDTTATLACSLDCGTHTYGFEYAIGQFAEAHAADSVEKYIKDSINAVAGMKDTVVASDSAGYVKVVSLFGQQHLEDGARWTLKLGTGLTKGDSTVTTIRSIIGAMVAAINDSTALADTVTAANSGDSVYTITANKKGVAFTIAIGDTSQDTSKVVANKTSSSATTDTLRIGNTGGYNTLHAKIYIAPEISADAAIGKDDSCIIWLYTTFAGDSYLADSTICTDLPCSLQTYIISTIGDTLLRDGIYMKYLLRDTCTDTIATVTYPVSWNLYLK